MAKTTEHIGKVAHMAGALMDFIGGGGIDDFASAGLTHVGFVQVIDRDDQCHTFAEIVGECDPAIFTEILTKAEANKRILEICLSEIEFSVEGIFLKEYVRRFVPDSFFEKLPNGVTYGQILNALKAEGYDKLLRVSTYNGPLFPED